MYCVLEGYQSNLPRQLKGILVLLLVVVAQGRAEELGMQQGWSTQGQGTTGGESITPFCGIS
jgi:hypothetical protein